MYLIRLTLPFETKLMDIAYLLLLKLNKEHTFKTDEPFFKLYLKVLMKQGRNKEALAFIEKYEEFYVDKPHERKQIES